MNYVTLLKFYFSEINCEHGSFGGIQLKSQLHT